MIAPFVRPRSGQFLLCLASAAFALGACGDNKKAGITPSPDGAVVICGNGLLEGDEQCDDDDTIADLVCTADCKLTCGNGVVDTMFGETCDTGVASGADACPTACDDGMACTSDVLEGTGCETRCINEPITAAANGDGCCPSGATSLTDDDCSPVCGNSAVEAGEVCDTGITNGAGVCPTSCNDSQACTTDVLSMGGTCMASCTNTAITAPANNDGCCPTGANSGNDNDCIASCGNGVVDTAAGETCDTAITSGTGSCPTTCNDNVACTSNVLSNAGTCTAACVFPPITTCTNGDGCCPTGCNATNDNTCQPMCGNGVTEGTEQCDDGNMVNTDSCSNTCQIPPVAFKFNDLDLRDPHVFVSLVFCNDVTDTQLAGFSVNNELQTNIQADGDGDGLLDLAPTMVFRSFSQTAASQPMELHFADCTAPNNASTTCSPSGETVVNATATTMSAGQCLTFLPGTVRPYSPAITSTGAPCFVTSPTTVTINLGGIPITLRDARIAATLVGNPANTMSNGLLMGFISEADANSTLIPTSFPLVGGKPLSSLLAGGSGSCPSHSDKDSNNGVMGWWFYLNFPARRVPWSD
jgi:cysteine-rich repeat protein